MGAQSNQCDSAVMGTVCILAESRGPDAPPPGALDEGGMVKQFSAKLISEGVVRVNHHSQRLAQEHEEQECEDGSGLVRAL